MSKSTPTRKYNLTEGSVGLKLLALTLPMVWGVFSVIAFNLADTYFVGQLGTTQLAAMSFTFPVVMVMGSLALGLGTGASSVISRAIGEGDRDRVQRLTTNSLTLSLLIVGVFILIGLATIDPLFKLLGAGPEVMPYIRDYMQIWYPGMIFLVVPMVGNSAIRAAGDTKIPSLIMTFAAIVNIALDPVLIFGWAFVPSLGLKGGALATVIARSLTLIASLIILHFRERMILWSLTGLRNCWDCWKEILYVGLPAASTNMITPISIGIITSLLASYSPEAVAGFGISSRVESFALIAFMALSATIGPFVGQNWGAKLYGRVHRSLHFSYLFCIGFGVLLAAVLAATSAQIVTLFDTNSQVLKTATRYLSIVPISYGTYGIFLVACAAFNGLGKPFPAVMLTLSRMVVLYVPLAYLGSWLFGLNGIFAAACISNLIVGITAIIWTRRSCSLKVDEPSEPPAILPSEKPTVNLSDIKDKTPR
ncbi:MATE family efflux transporter [Capilliphycus salinus ALCB114379]|uniref:MATE family efflux transporter n=1 Tax=Capilliphycus salinus TaxID=2768948 RepID=UPI0039A5485C